MVMERYDGTQIAMFTRFAWDAGLCILRSQELKTQKCRLCGGNLAILFMSTKEVFGITVVFCRSCGDVPLIPDGKLEKLYRVWKESL